MLGMARSMMKGMKVPGWLWGEAVSTAVFVLNRSPTRSVEGRIPYEVWYGSKPVVHFFRAFGCIAHVKVAGGHQKKLEDRSMPMVFIGYEPGSKAYRFLNPSTGRVLISRDAVFDEGRAWNWDDASTSTANNDSGEPFTVEYMTMFIPGGRGLPPPLGGSPPSSGAALSTPTGVLGTRPSSPSRGATTASTPVPGPPAGVEFVSPPSGDLELDADHEDDAPL